MAFLPVTDDFVANGSFELFFSNTGDEPVQCRFCWCTEESDDNPLILACKCAGTVGYIHYNCLKSWLKTQRHVKEYGENVTSYYWKKFECEICK